MKVLRSGAIAVAFLLLVTACKKTTSFITSTDALLTTSADTLHFDTLFTTTGSITQVFKIFNLNDRKLRLSEVRLMGGAGSAFKLNVDGAPGVTFSNVEIEPNDSVYVFVSVKINPSGTSLPFVVQDSILINYNGNTKFVQLDAYGQNARFLRGVRVTQDSTFTSDLPIVILDRITVDSGVTLTVNAGTSIYHHANAPFIVNGSLHIEGGADSSQRVRFTGDRLDEGYRDLPGSWPGLIFSPASDNNVLQYAIILNAYQAIVSSGAPVSGHKIILEQCVIDNSFDAGILAGNSNIKAVNCLISNCGRNLVLVGGNYTFEYCTVASYSTILLEHKNPVLTITDKDDQGTQVPVHGTFTNCIFYGEGGFVSDETLVEITTPPSDVVFTTCLQNIDPQFVATDVSKFVFDFHLKATSPANDTGTGIPGVPVDLDGNQREVPANKPDIGCFERQ